MMGIYFGVVTTTGASDEHESITVRSDEAAIPVDVGGSMIGSVKKEPVQFVTVTCLSSV